MKRLLCSLLVMIAGCRPPSDPAAPSAASSPSPPPASANRFLALGDSYTIGESVAASERWPVQLAKLLREQGLDVADPQIIATTGWTTDELSAGMDAARPVGPCRLVTLLIGVNNQFRGRGIERIPHAIPQPVGPGDRFGGRQANAGRGGVHSRLRRHALRGLDESGEDPPADRRIQHGVSGGGGPGGAAFVDITPGSRDAATDPSLVAATACTRRARCTGAGPNRSCRSCSGRWGAKGNYGHTASDCAGPSTSRRPNFVKT